MVYQDVAILIPAYRPDPRMNTFIRDLKEAGFSRIIVVDDGGGGQFASLFAEAQTDGAVVLVHEENRGKGAALKTGIQYLQQHGTMPVITADADGQHACEDVKKVADALRQNPDSLVLGTRDKKQMPARSKFGNNVTCVMLGMLTGMWIQDTQTGLRGIPKDALDDFALLDGDRYEYEMNVLIKAEQLNMAVVQVVIQTIYDEGNATSHFHVIRDSWHIYKCLFQQIAKYCGASAISGIVDYIVFLTLHLFFPGNGALLPSMAVARLISSLVNYFANRDLVFKSRAGKRSLLYYYMLVAAVFVASYLLTRAFVELRIPPWAGQPISALVLFVVSYNVQQKYIFCDNLREKVSD